MTNKLNLITELKGPKENKVPVVKTVAENVARILLRHQNYEGRFRKNEFAHQYEVKEKDGEWHNLEDKHSIKIREEIVNEFGDLVTLSLKMTDEGIDQACESNVYNPVVDYLKNLKWDKISRLDDFCHKVYNTENDEYHKQAGAKFLKGMVHRAIEPGAKNDSVFIIEGNQGAFKSTSLTILAGGPKFHIETAGKVDSGNGIKMMLEEATGGWIVEFAEGAILKKSDAENIKAFVSKTHDKVRWAYGRRTMTLPRAFVFAMTTNNTVDYLRDPSGARRFVPVRCKGHANTEWLKENKDQLFAEAVYRVFELGEKNHSVASHLAEEHQEARTESVEYEDAVTKYVMNLTYAEIVEDHTVQNNIIWKKAELGGGNEPSAYQAAQIGKTLSQKLKMEKRRKLKGRTVLYRYWVPSEDSPEFLQETENQKKAREAMMDLWGEEEKNQEKIEMNKSKVIDEVNKKVGSKKNKNNE